jgi:hypothetical protein
MMVRNLVKSRVGFAAHSLFLSHSPFLSQKAVPFELHILFHRTKPHSDCNDEPLSISDGPFFISTSLRFTFSIIFDNRATASLTTADAELAVSLQEQTMSLNWTRTNGRLTIFEAKTIMVGRR